jgi:hypothetical protein
MDQILTDNIWRQVAPFARRCTRRVAALAYVSASTLIRFRKDDILVCDASDAAIKSGETSASALSKWYRGGVQIYSRPGLHAKLLVMGNRALIGSANLSESSAYQLREASLLTSRTSVVSQAKAFVYLAKSEAIEVDETFLARARRLKVVRLEHHGFSKRQKHRPLGSRFWAVRVTEVDPAKYKSEELLVDEATERVREITGDESIEPTWIRFTGSSQFRAEAQAGDTVVELSSTREGKQITVQAPSAILLRQDKQHWTRFYCDPSTELPKLPWTTFRQNLTRLGVKGITRYSVRELNRKDAALIQTIWEE